jgi:hypothetical protein
MVREMSEDFVRYLASKIDHQDEGTDAPAPDPDVEAAALAAAVRAWNARYEFRPGDLVRPRDGLTMYQLAGSHFFAVLGPISPPAYDPDTDMPLSFRLVPNDLWVAARQSDGSVVPKPMCSWFLEPVPREELARLGVERPI